MRSRVWRAALGVFLAMVFFSGGSILPVSADDPMVLVLGGEGSMTWTIGNIQPGDTGGKRVTLFNDSEDWGAVIIWISDIVQGEGPNPEPETGNLSAPGELGKYLYLDCSSSFVKTNIDLPSTIKGLPQSVDDWRFLRVSPLEYGKTAEIHWRWEFRETGECQNDAMGDFISFTINYMLEELPPVPEDDNNGGLVVDVLGSPTDVKLTNDGIIRQTTVASSLDNLCQVLLEPGTRISGPDGCPVMRIIIRKHEGILPVPDGSAMVGPAYEVIGLCEGGEIRDIEFQPPVKLTIRYAPEWLPEPLETLAVRRWEPESNWLSCEDPPGNTGRGGNAALISSGGIYALIAEIMPQDHVPGETPSPPTEYTPVPDPPATRTKPDVEQGLSAPVDSPGPWLTTGIAAGIVCLLTAGVLFAVLHGRKTKRRAPH